MKGLKIIAGLGAATILTACGSSAGGPGASGSGSAAPVSTPSTSSGPTAAGSTGNGSSNGSGNGGGVDGSNSGGTPAGAGNKPKKGIISGVLERVGGPIGSGGQQPTIHPVSGTVTFTSQRHGTFTAQAGSNGQFSMKLPIGSYHLSGQSPKVMVNGTQERCIRPAAVNVGVDENVRVEINCIVR
jgi:hypothetical protein